MSLYRVESGTVAHDVRDWCQANGDDPKLRIALCGYEGEHDALESAGWSVVAWETLGGYASQSSRGNANARRERVWFSPHCVSVEKSYPLFARCGM